MHIYICIPVYAHVCTVTAVCGSTCFSRGSIVTVFSWHCTQPNKLCLPAGLSAFGPKSISAIDNFISTLYCTGTQMHAVCVLWHSCALSSEDPMSELPGCCWIYAVLEVVILEGCRQSLFWQPKKPRRKNTRECYLSIGNHRTTQAKRLSFTRRKAV